MTAMRKWYWRVLLSSLASIPSVMMAWGLTIAMGRFGLSVGLAWLVLLLMWFIPSVSVALAYHWLAMSFGGIRFDSETRCRKCDYILKGITEPRCPECGERI